VLTVAADPDLAGRLLRDGELACPRCELGVLGGHGWVPGRWLRKTDGQVVLLKAHATGRLRAAFTALVHRVGSSPPVMTSGGGPVAGAVAAIGEAAAAVRRLLGARMAAVPPWAVAAAVPDGSLLAVTPQDRLFSMSRHLPAAM